MKARTIAAFLLCITGLHSWADDSAFRAVFETNVADFASAGTNGYFILMPGYQLVLQGTEYGRTVVLTITVLDETRTIDGVETRVVEERETADGVPTEISRNYFAISKVTGNVYYFGEDVDGYKDGKIAGHEGSWHSGEKGAKFGLMMPGHPSVGDRFYQEVAPGLAMDRAEIVSLTDELDTGVGVFTNCLKTAEGSPLEAGLEYKLHAPGVGLIQDEELLLVSYGFR